MNTKYMIKLLLVSSLLLTSTVCYAGTFFVSTDGNDSNTGSKNSPFKTLQKAIAQVEPGDTIYIRGGVYHQQSYIYKSGEPDNYIKIMAYNDEDVVFDGKNELKRFIKVGEWFDEEKSAHYIWIEGLELRYFTEDGIASLHGSSNNVFINIHAHNNAHHAIQTFYNVGYQPGNSGYNRIENFHAEFNGYHGIKLGGVGNKVINCRINNNGWNELLRDGEGLQVSDINWDVAIEGVTSHGNRRNGIRVNAKKYLSGSVINNVETYNNGRNGIDIGGDAEDINITNADTYNNSVRGISIASNAKDVNIVNSKSYSNIGQGIRISNNANGIHVYRVESFDNNNVGILILDDVENVEIRECLIYGNSSEGILVRGNSKNVGISDSRISNNGYHGIGMASQDGIEGINENITLKDNIIYGNSFRAILIYHVNILNILGNTIYSSFDSIESELEYRDSYSMVNIVNNTLNPNPIPPINLKVDLANN